MQPLDMLVELLPVLRDRCTRLLKDGEKLHFTWDAHARRIIVDGLRLDNQPPVIRSIGQWHATHPGGDTWEFLRYTVHGESSHDSSLFPHGNPSRKQSEAWSDFMRNR